MFSLPRAGAPDPGYRTDIHILPLMTRHAGRSLSHESRGSRPGLLAADQQPLAPDRKRHPVLCGSAEPSWPLGGGGERPAAVSLGQDDGQLGQRGQSLALCQRGQEPGDEGIPAPVVSSGVTFALPTPAARHPDGPPHLAAPGSPAPAPGPRGWRAPRPDHPHRSAAVAPRWRA